MVNGNNFKHECNSKYCIIKNAPCIWIMWCKTFQFLVKMARVEHVKVSHGKCDVTKTTRYFQLVLPHELEVHDSYELQRTEKRTIDKERFNKFWLKIVSSVWRNKTWCKYVRKFAAPFPCPVFMRMRKIFGNTNSKSDSKRSIFNATCFYVARGFAWTEWSMCNKSWSAYISK